MVFTFYLRESVDTATQNFKISRGYNIKQEIQKIKRKGNGELLTGSHLNSILN